MLKILRKDIVFKSSKKKLIVSGDSFADYRYTSTHGFTVWPDILGEMLDMEVINMGNCGSGNEYIYSSLLDCFAKEDNIGLVIAMWSESCRIDFEVPLEEKNRKLSWGRRGWRVIVSLRKNKEIWEDVVATFFRKHGYYQLHARTKKSMRFMYSFQEIMKNRNLNFLQVAGCGLESPMDSNELSKLILDSPYFDLIDKKYFVGWPMVDSIGGKCISDYLKQKDPTRTKNIIDGTKVSDDDGDMISPVKDFHPNKLGHEQIAKVLYDAYQKTYAIS